MTRSRNTILHRLKRLRMGLDHMGADHMGADHMGADGHSRPVIEVASYHWHICIHGHLCRAGGRLGLWPVCVRTRQT